MRVAASPPTEQILFFPCSTSRSVPRMYAAALQRINALVSRLFPSGRTTSIAIGRVFQRLIFYGKQTSAFALHLPSMAGERWVGGKEWHRLRGRFVINSRAPFSGYSDSFTTASFTPACLLDPMITLMPRRFSVMQTNVCSRMAQLSIRN
jgi:hypothetical protein